MNEKSVMPCSQPIALTAALFAAMVVSVGPAWADDRKTIGYVERVLLYPGEVLFLAKIDTGAKTSSVDVDELTEFSRDGKTWVRFTMVNRKQQKVTLERPVVRMSKVRRSGTKKQVRYVVNVGLCLGDYYKEAEVGLTDREGLNYRMLIGRLFLGNKFLIDPSAFSRTKPDCPDAPQW